MFATLMATFSGSFSLRKKKKLPDPTPNLHAWNRRAALAEATATLRGRN